MSVNSFKASFNTHVLFLQVFVVLFPDLLNIFSCVEAHRNRENKQPIEIL